jgi:DNA mismatch repair protein MutS2
MGILKSVVNIKNLEILEEEKPKQKQQQSSSYKANFMKSATISPEINLLGKTVDEAINELDKYLDDAYLSKLTQVTIIHGKGTGALRSAVQSYLRKQKHIKSFRSGVYGEGEAGVTIVEF